MKQDQPVAALPPVEADTDACERCGLPERKHPVVYVGDGSMPPQIHCYDFRRRPSPQTDT